MGLGFCCELASSSRMLLSAFWSAVPSWPLVGLKRRPPLDRRIGSGPLDGRNGSESGKARHSPARKQGPHEQNKRPRVEVETPFIPWDAGLGPSRRHDTWRRTAQ